MALDEADVKHLEFIQAVIARLANNSFFMKGWALTAAGLFYGFAVKGTSWPVAAIGLLPTVAFWGLDAYYLRQERLYRRLYDAVRREDASIEPFSMNAQPFADEVAEFLATVLSKTELPFYGGILVIGMAVIGAIH
jgi:hypothetical protein